jgi:archaellum component FlaC
LTNSTHTLRDFLIYFFKITKKKIQELRKSYEKEQQNTDLEHETLSFTQNEEIRQIEEKIKVCQNDLERFKSIYKLKYYFKKRKILMCLSLTKKKQR